jgi:hypothetical protein
VFSSKSCIIFTLPIGQWSSLHSLFVRCDSGVPLCLLHVDRQLSSITCWENNSLPYSVVLCVCVCVCVQRERERQRQLLMLTPATSGIMHSYKLKTDLDTGYYWPWKIIICCYFQRFCDDACAGKRVLFLLLVYVA